MTRPIRILDVKPKIPENLKALHDIAYNLWFAWNHDAENLFLRIRQDLWEDTRKNPVEFLGRLKQQELEDLNRDEGFLAHLERINQEFVRYVQAKTDPQVFGEGGTPFVVAYFTAECGVADCLPIYSGGLGILSGDHMKSASDLNLPIIGVSLAYQKGYFRQYLIQDGWQNELYPVNQFSSMPMTLVRNGDGSPLNISVDMKGTAVSVQAWRVQIGRTSLYLLDTNVAGNPDWARDITAELYGGDHEMRLRQEIILGIGGVRMLRAVGLEPSVFHMNEGHSAFAVFERIRDLRETRGLNFEEAVECVRATSVFTTHTPVAAGIDTFHPDLMRTYFETFAKSLGITFEVLMGFGKQDPRDKGEEFCMTVLALRLATWNNGVSRLHGKISRRMWKMIWPKTPEIDLPIGYVTNGVHIPSWISEEAAENYNRYLGPRWIEDPDNVKIWERVDSIPNSEVWRTHGRAKERLVAFSRKRLKAQLANRGVPNRDLEFADEVLNADALTIGYARRFAPYKRAHLIIHDIERLERILTRSDMPVQIIFAGKAHPQDTLGKELIKQIVQICNRETIRRHMVFLEDYDFEIARHMVQGVDVWLNTPRRPLEACGTSGMKAVANGALHFSVLDGWWDEGYDREVGWAIGNGEEYTDTEFQDHLESRALYDVLEKDIIPLFYDRGTDDIPRRWVVMMKASMHKLCPVFNTHRMVEEYWERYYIPAAERGQRLMANGGEDLKSLSEWRKRIMYNWGNVAIRRIQMQGPDEIELGQTFHVEADIFLGELAPEDLIVEAYCGRVDPSDQFLDRFSFPMMPTGGADDHVYHYQGDVRFDETGHFGVNVRVIPNHPDPESRHSMGLVIWGET